MKQLHVVEPQYIYKLWDSIEPFFDAAYRHSPDDCTLDQMKMLLVRGSQTLFVIMDDNQIIGALAVEVINYPNHRVAHTSAIGGKGVFDSDTISQYELWAKQQGCTKIRAWAKDSQARLYRMKLGLQKTMNVVEKDI